MCEGVRDVRQRVVLFAGAPRCLPELQPLRHRDEVSVRRLGPCASEPTLQTQTQARADECRRCAKEGAPAMARLKGSPSHVGNGASTTPELRTPLPRPRGEGKSHPALAHIRTLLFFLLALTLLATVAEAGPDQDLRFPAPEFRSGYTFPETAVPPATAEAQPWIDVAVLAGALSVAAWLAVKRHSRRGVFWLMIFSLLS